MEIELSDGFARPRRYNFKLSVIDPNKSQKARLGPDALGNFTVTKAQLRIISIGRDGKVRLRVVANGRAEDIIRGITNVSFAITIQT